MPVLLFYWTWTFLEGILFIPFWNCYHFFLHSVVTRRIFLPLHHYPVYRVVGLSRPSTSSYLVISLLLDLFLWKLTFFHLSSPVSSQFADSSLRTWNKFSFPEMEIIYRTFINMSHHLLWFFTLNRYFCLQMKSIGKVYQTYLWLRWDDKGFSWDFGLSDSFIQRNFIYLTFIIIIFNIWF